MIDLEQNNLITLMSTLHVLFIVMLNCAYIGSIQNLHLESLKCEHEKMETRKTSYGPCLGNKVRKACSINVRPALSPVHAVCSGL